MRSLSHSQFRSRGFLKSLGSSFLLSAAVLLALVSGCKEIKQATEEASKAAQSDRTSESLKLMGESIHNYHDANRQFPGSWDELIQFERESGRHASVFEDLRDKGCVVTGWGLKMQDIVVGSANYVFAYLPDVAQNGGPALRADGSAFHISADELKQALNNQKDVKPRN